MVAAIYQPRRKFCSYSDETREQCGQIASYRRRVPGLKTSLGNRVPHVIFDAPHLGEEASESQPNIKKTSEFTCAITNNAKIHKQYLQKGRREAARPKRVRYKHSSWDTATTHPQCCRFRRIVIQGISQKFHGRPDGCPIHCYLR